MARNQNSEAGTKAKGQRIKQIRAAYQMTRQVDPRVLPIVLLVGVGTLTLFVVAGLVFDQILVLTLAAVPIALLAMVITFTRRAEKAAFSQVEGQPGAAAAVLTNMRRGWTVTPVIAATRNQDVVHRAVGRPGIVLIGEGSPSRVGNLIAAEKRKTARIVGETPIYDLIAGNGADQVPLRRLQAHLMKLPRNLRPGEVSELNNRLRAVGERNLPIPKGPLPKNARVPRGGKPR